MHWLFPPGPRILGSPHPRAAVTEALALRLTAALTGRYAIERLLGQGGMATVYLARDLRHDRRVPVQNLLPALTRPTRTR